MLKSYLPALVFLLLGIGIGTVFTLANNVLGPKRPIVLHQRIAGKAGQQLGMAAEEDARRQREQPTEQNDEAGSHRGEVREGPLSGPKL